MTLIVARQESAARFGEAQSYLSYIKVRETSGREPESAAVNLEKGLFLVVLYGALEYSVTKVATEVASSITQKKVSYCHLCEAIYSIALDPELASAATVGRSKRWGNRVAVFQRQGSHDVVSLDASVVLKDLDNIWAETFADLFLVFGISSASLYSPRVRQYIDEIAERRNAVAHGRESASLVGRAYTTSRLQTLLDEASLQNQYVFAQFEFALNAKYFIRSDFHDKY